MIVYKWTQIFAVLDFFQELSDSDIDEELKIVQPPAHLRAEASAAAVSSDDEEEVF